MGAILTLSTIWGACLSSASAPKVDSFISAQLAKHSSAPLRVIIRFKDQATSAQLDRLRALGAEVYRHLDIIHAVAATVPASKFPALEKLPFVTSISSDAVVHKSDQFTVNSSLAGQAWLNYGVSGSGVGVAVLDSGINVVDDLKPGSGTMPAVNFSDDNTTADLCGHGTHVAGILAGTGVDSTGPGFTKTFYGIAQGARLVNVKVLDSTGAGSVSSVCAAIAWAITNRPTYNIRVLNLSFGHAVGETYQTDPLCQSLEAAWKAGIVVVCAAGNDGRLNATPTAGAANSGYGINYGSIESPGNDPYVITVGATKSMDGNRADDQIASYSSRGPSRIDHILKPDIIAPGNQIVSTVNESNCYIWKNYQSQVQLPLSFYTNGGSGYSANYYVLSGTSMATPVVSGAAALMLGRSPGLSPDTVKARLMFSADKWADPTGTGDASTYGSGYIDIPAALGSTVTAHTYAMSPQIQQSNGNLVVNLLDSVLNLLFGIWDTGIDLLSDVYGSRALWGSNNLASNRALWGSAFWTNNSSYTVSSTSLNFSGSGTLLNGEH